MKQYHRMTEQEFKLLINFLGRKTLTDVDGGLRRAVESLFKEHSALREELVKEHGKQLASKWWDRWEAGEYDEELEPKQVQRLKTTTVMIPKTDHRAPLKFKPKLSTGDKRLIKDKLYSGYFIKLKKKARSGTRWRVYILRCEDGKPMTFNPDIFDYAGG